MIVPKASSIVLEEVTDSAELARARLLQEHLRTNSDWLQAHIRETYARRRGKCICVAGRELFVADSAAEVLGMARSVHPHDQGPLLRYISREKMERVYAL